jgi:hypothetical protein
MEGGEMSAENNGHMQQAELPIHGLVAPVVFGFAVETDINQRAVAMRLETPMGSLVFIMPAKGAKEMGKQLMAGARSALLGLEIVGGQGGGLVDGDADGDGDAEKGEGHVL